MIKLVLNRFESPAFSQRKGQIYSIDPAGLFSSGATGWARWISGILVGCGLAPVQVGTSAPDAVVIELPSIRPGARKEDLNDLIQVALGAGYWLGGLCTHADLLLPTVNDWKGQVPKKIQNDRDFAKLTPGERDLLQVCGAKRHNVLDAIGIGLWALGRR